MKRKMFKDMLLFFLFFSAFYSSMNAMRYKWAHFFNCAKRLSNPIKRLDCSALILENVDVEGAAFKSVMIFVRNDFVVFSDLVKKCQRPNRRIVSHTWGYSKRLLELFELVDEEGNVPQEVEEIVCYIVHEIQELYKRKDYEL